MRFVKPQYYEDFRCVAANCPDTCCEGWQIVIDDEALKRYSRVTGPFGNRLYNSIDWKDGCFKQKNARCCFLNQENLCDLYKELGEESLCQTCTMYPRHVEEFEGVRELSLSLSCPIAAQMILQCKEPLRFLEEETCEEELIEDFEDFDTFMFTQLEDAREVVFAILQDRSIDVKTRILLVMELAKEMQDCVEEEKYCDIDAVIGQYGNNRWKNLAIRQKELLTSESDSGCTKQRRYDDMMKEYCVLQGLERLRGEWDSILQSAYHILYSRGEEHYLAVCEAFDEYFGCNSRKRDEWSLFTENLMIFFVYTYFCGAVYDDWIYSKMALAEFSVRWIQELIMAVWAAEREKDETGNDMIASCFDWKLCIDISYRYAREIEHSDENLNALEEWLIRK